MEGESVFPQDGTEMDLREVLQKTAAEVCMNVNGKFMILLLKGMSKGYGVYMYVGCITNLFIFLQVKNKP